MIGESEATPEGTPPVKAEFRSPSGPGWVGVTGPALYQPRDIDDEVDESRDPRAVLGDENDDEDLSDRAPWQPEDD